MKNEGKANLEAVVSRGDLRRLLDGQNITRAYRPTRFDSELLKVADGAVESCVPTAIVLPVPGTKTPVLLAASMLISSFVRTEKLTSHIALVSKQAGLRQFYDALYVGKYNRMGEHFPRTVVDLSGLALDSSELPLELLKKRGRLHFVPAVERLERLRFKRSPSLIKLDGMVVESQACDEDGLRRLLTASGKTPIIYLTVDPYDPALALFQETGAIWAWDTARMASFASDEPDGEAICTGAEILAGAAETNFDIVGPENDTNLDAALARLWDDLLEMRRNPAGPAFGSLSWVWGVFATLSQLVVPLEDYDKCACLSWNTTVLSEAPVKAAAFGRNAADEEEQELWQILADDLDDAIEAAREDDYKPVRMAEWVDNLSSSRTSGVIVARNRAMAKAIGSYLQEYPRVPMGWSDVVETVTLSDLSSGRKVMGTGEALIPGPLSWRHGWLFALPTADRVTVLAHGPWETSRAVRQIEGMAKRLGELAHGYIRDRATLKLFGQEVHEEANPWAGAPRIRCLTNRAAKAPVTVRDAVWSPFDLKVARLLNRANVGPPNTLSASDYGTGLVEAILVSFDDGAGFFEPNCLLSKLHEGTIKEVACKSLRSGDRVVLIEREARRDLFTVIVETLEDLPDFAPTLALIEEWHERARHAGLRCGLDNDQILARMSGTRITNPSTIGCWIKGLRHGPNSPEDIKRFGAAVGDEFLVKKWEIIGRALTTIRGHRIKVGRMLNAALTGTSSTDMEDSGYFDRRLGIHYSDLMEVVSAHVVREVADKLEPVPQLQVNRLLESGESPRKER